MKLGQKQQLFARLLPRLIDKAHELGFEVRVGEVQRGEQQAEWNSTHCAKCKKTKSASHPGHRFTPIGIRKSLHRQKLAVDLTLFAAGQVRWNTESYSDLGKWWVAQSGDDFECCWGGHFRDAGHFSIGHGGRK